MNVNRNEMTPVPDEGNQHEYILYAQHVERTLSQLEASLHDSDDPEDFIMKMLTAATEFYDGDWAGIMEADLTMKIGSLLWWYNRRTQGMTPNYFGDLQEGEYSDLSNHLISILQNKTTPISEQLMNDSSNLLLAYQINQ